MDALTPVLHIIVPVLNEEGNVARFVEGLTRLRRDVADEFDVRLILVDDGSTDGTAAAARQAAGDSLPLTVLSHAVNRGPGMAFATAFEHLASRLGPEDWVLTIEGDNTSRMDTLRQMLVRRREGFDVVLASPYMYGGGITNTSLLRTLLSHAANLTIKELLGIRGILTMSSFFRLLSGRMVRRLQAAYGPRIIERAGFECMLELLFKLVQLQATISEVAMTLDSNARVGRSKMRILRTIRGYLAIFAVRRRWMRKAAAPPAAAASQMAAR